MPPIATDETELVEIVILVDQVGLNLSLPSNNSLNPKLKRYIEAKDNNNNQILSKDNQDYQNSRILINKYLFLILLTTIEKEKSFLIQQVKINFFHFLKTYLSFNQKALNIRKAVRVWRKYSSYR